MVSQWHLRFSGYTHTSFVLKQSTIFNKVSWYPYRDHIVQTLCWKQPLIIKIFGNYIIYPIFFVFITGWLLAMGDILSAAKVRLGTAGHQAYTPARGCVVHYASPRYPHDWTSDILPVQGWEKMLTI